MSSPEGVTQLLIDWSKGDQGALENLMPLVYNELRRLATNYLRRERLGRRDQAQPPIRLGQSLPPADPRPEHVRGGVVALADHA